MAVVFQSPEARGVLLHMAQTWLQLADRIAPPHNATDSDANHPDP
jgi:hypothetical protein